MDIRDTFSNWFALFSGRDNACGKKHQYQSPVLATKAAYNMEVKYPGEIFDVYRCPFCNFYHIGHAVDPTKFGFSVVVNKEENEDTST